MVLLVEKDVVLPDGSTTRALVPQLYVRLKDGDINGHGALLAADSINLKISDSANNSGTIAGRNLLIQGIVQKSKGIISPTSIRFKQ